MPHREQKLVSVCAVCRDVALQWCDDCDSPLCDPHTAVQGGRTLCPSCLSLCAVCGEVSAGECPRCAVPLCQDHAIEPKAMVRCELCEEEFGALLHEWRKRLALRGSPDSDATWADRPTNGKWQAFAIVVGLPVTALISLWSIPAMIAMLVPTFVTAMWGDFIFTTVKHSRLWLLGKKRRRRQFLKERTPRKLLPAPEDSDVVKQRE